MTYDREQWQASQDNGRIPLHELERIEPVFFDVDLGGAAMLHPEAAAAMSALIAEARSHGIIELRVIYSYRTFAKQQEKWDNYQAGGNLAASPGTSNHGWAVACDMGGLTSRALSFLRNNARRFGYVNDVPSEDWHWVYYEHIWDGETGDGEDDVKFEKFLDAQEKCLKRYKDRIGMGKDGDPGPPPDGMDDPYAVKGWNFMRASLNNPVPHKS